MGLMDKLQFWRKDDDMGDFNPPSLDSPNQGFGPDPLGDQNSMSGPMTPDDNDGFSISHGVGPSHRDLADDGSVDRPGALNSMNQSYPNRSFNPGQDRQGIIEKDLEVLSSKMDMIKASLESMDQRLRNIEDIAKREQEYMHKSAQRW